MKHIINTLLATGTAMPLALSPFVKINSIYYVISGICLILLIINFFRPKNKAGVADALVAYDLDD